MKITKEQLKQIIKEELEAVMENEGGMGYILTLQPDGRVRQGFVSSLSMELKPNQKFIPYGASQEELDALASEMETGPPATAVGNVRGPSAYNPVKDIVGYAPEIPTDTPEGTSEPEGHRVKYPRTR